MCSDDARGMQKEDPSFWRCTISVSQSKKGKEFTSWQIKQGIIGEFSKLYFQRGEMSQAKVKVGRADGTQGGYQDCLRTSPGLKRLDVRNRSLIQDAFNPLCLPQ